MKQNSTEHSWGTEETWALTNHYVAKILTLDNTASFSMQLHERKEKTIRVIDGSVRIHYREAEDDLYGAGSIVNTTLNSGENFHIAPGQLHRIEPLESVTRLLEVSTPEIDDVIELE